MTNSGPGITFRESLDVVVRLQVLAQPWTSIGKQETARDVEHGGSDGVRFHVQNAQDTWGRMSAASDIYAVGDWTAELRVGEFSAEFIAELGALEVRNMSRFGLLRWSQLRLCDGQSCRWQSLEQ